MISVFYVILQDHVIKEPCDFMVNYHLFKFGGHRHCDSKDIIILVCQVISQDDAIKGSCELIGKNPSR